MNGKRTTSDWMLLSAYIDGELAASKKNKLEERLRANLQLRQDLQKMKVTRSMLRSLPRKKVPRSFALSPQMVTQRKRSSWLPVFTLTSAASTVVALLILLIQIIPGGLMNAQPMLAKEAASELAMSADEITQEAEGSDPEIIYWGGPPNQIQVEGKGGGGESVPPMGETNMQAQPEMLAQPVEEETVLEAPREPALAEPAPDMEEPLQEDAFEANPDAESLIESEPIEDSTAEDGQSLEDSGPILGIRPTQETGQMIAETAPPPVRSHSQNTLVWAIVFLGLAVGSGMIALILWRRK